MLRLFDQTKAKLSLIRDKGWRFVFAEAQVSFFPIALVLLLAALSYWLAVVSSPTEEDKSGRFRHDPDAYIAKFTVRTFNEAGIKRDVLSGTYAEHYPDDESIMIQKPILVHNNGNDVPATKVRSNVALINSDQSEIELKGDVVGNRPAYGDRKSVTFLTSQIMVYPDEERAETTHRVKIYEGKSWMAGTGFDMDNVTQTYNFHSNVEGSRVTETQRK